MVVGSIVYVLFVAQRTKSAELGGIRQQRVSPVRAASVSDDNLDSVVLCYAALAGLAGI